MTIGKIALCTILLIILGYVGFHLYGVIAPPRLELANPPPGFTTSQPAITVAGTTLPGAKIAINGSLVLPTAAGTFSELVVLHKGINTILVSARKRYSRPATLERQVLMLKGEPLSQFNVNPNL